MTTYSFDLETTGLSADSEITSFAMVSAESKYCISQCLPGQDGEIDDKCLLISMYDVIAAKNKGDVIVTYNGGNYKGGFDFPLLRTRFCKHGIAWPFTGMMHVDLYPVIEKRWNTAVLRIPKLDQLKRKEQLIAVGMALDLNLDSKQTIAVLNQQILQNAFSAQIVDAIEKTQDIKPVDINSLKGAYAIITGKDPGEMDGAGAVELWLQYKETGDEKYLIELRQYNIEDCQKTLELYDICKMCCSQRDMQPEIL